MTDHGKHTSVLLIRELFTVDRLGRVRELVRWAARIVGLNRDRTDGLLQAVNEAATNAILHGGGKGCLELVQTNETSLTARIIDEGPGLPSVDEVERPTVTATSGRGRWLMQYYCDRVRYLTSRTGTIVELEMAISAACAG